MTAAATTGPASGPRPASSRPAASGKCLRRRGGFGFIHELRQADRPQVEIEDLLECPHDHRFGILYGNAPARQFAKGCDAEILNSARNDHPKGPEVVVAVQR